MNIKKLMEKDLPEIPYEVADSLFINKITETTFENKNDILIDELLQKEAGYRKLEDGNYLVSMYCPMPGVTVDMIKWWFWWHPQEDKRYQVWYPVERVGEMRMPLRIEFVEPKSFGFSEELMKESNIPLIICGHVAAYKGLIKHTEMAHIFKQTEDGLFLISRF